MAKPSTALVAASCAEPTSTGGVCGPTLSMINEALAEMLRSNDAANSGKGAGRICGNPRGNESGPLPLGSAASPNRLSRAVVAELLLLTKVKAVVQFSSAARCAVHGADEVQTRRSELPLARS